MEFEEFAKLAKEKFGDKVNISYISINNENLTKFNEMYDSKLNVDDFKNYGEHVWLVKNECPNCGEKLDGLFGSFKWEIIHGAGSCSNCNKVEFRYYHYIGDCKYPLKLFSVTGF